MTNLSKILPNDQQRPELVEIVMRIVHARLLSHPNKNERMTYLVQKRKILGFLKNFTKSEINTFFQLSFDAIVQRDIKRINKKYLLANLQLINLILVEMASVIDNDGILFLINLLVTIADLTAELEYESEIRAKVLTCLCLVFEQFVHFNFTNEICEKIFETFVWPHLSHFTNNCKVSMSGLFKLFIEWSKNPKYYHLLEKSKEFSPIFHIMELLKSENTSKEIKVTIYKLLTRLLEDTVDSRFTIV